MPACAGQDERFFDLDEIESDLYPRRQLWRHRNRSKTTQRSQESGLSSSVRRRSCLSSRVGAHAQFSGATCTRPVHDTVEGRCVDVHAVRQASGLLQEGQNGSRCSSRLGATEQDRCLVSCRRQRSANKPPGVALVRVVLCLEHRNPLSIHHHLPLPLSPRLAVRTTPPTAAVGTSSARSTL